MTVPKMLEKIFDQIDRRADEFLQFTREMVRIPSVNPPGNYEEISRFVDERLKSFGLESRIVSPPEKMVEEKGLRFPRRNVVALLPGGSRTKKGILCVHLDTVPVANEHLWKHGPFSGEREDGKVWGCGSCDCKGRLASFALALTAIQKAGFTLGGDVILAATADEEIGGELGAGYLVSQGILQGDFCIVEGFLNEMIYGYAGMVHVKIITRGKAAHTALPWRGINAILRMEKVIQALTRAQEKLAQRPSRIEGMKYTTLNIGVIQGGAKASIVPDYCELEIDGRLVPEDRTDFTLDLVKQEIEKIRDLDPEFPYEFNVIRKNEAYHSDPNSSLIQAIQDSLATVGFSPTPIPVTMSRGGSDMKYFTPKGIPSVAFGAGRRPESNIHGADENISEGDFILATKATSATLVKLLGLHQ